MRILGVDPGTIKAGFAVVEDGKLLASAQIKIGSSDVQMHRRLHALKRYTELFIHDYGCKLVVYETGFIGRKASPQTSMAIHGARAAIMIAAAELGVEIAGYHPSTVKMVTGHGDASKDRVMRVMTALLHPDHELGEDEADACAIALTGEMEARKERLVQAGYAQVGVIQPPKRIKQKPG